MRTIINDGVMISTLTGPQLVKEYNERAAALQEPLVNRFATRSAAERRTLAIVERYNEKMGWKAVTKETGPKAKTATPAPAPKAEKPAKAPLVETPQTAEKPPRWARPKQEKPAAVAYLPRPGSIQAIAYDLLKQGGGVTMTDFCAAMKKTKTKDQTLYTPPMVWSALRYLFCATRGYGLDFDGERLRLIVPRTEKPAAQARSK